jgi:CO/xanthine dehydrogenase FAD-binding subunit
MSADPSEITEAEEEGIVIGLSQTPARIFGIDGKVSAVEYLDVARRTLDAEGRRRIETVPNSGHMVGADTVILAIGRKPGLSVIAGTEGLTITKRNTIGADPDTLATGAEGIFAGGDAAIAAGSVVKAIADGKRAAESIDRYLGGTGVQAEDGQPTAPFKRFSPSSLETSHRANPSKLPVSERIRSMDAEVDLGLSLSQVTAEANRCLNCGCVSVNASDIAPALIALNAEIKTTKRVIEAERFFTAESNRTTVLDGDEIVTEIRIPAPKPGTKQSFAKFAQRPAIDFSVVSIAAAITTEAGRVSDVRIALGAVAPTPYRATEAEAALKDKVINEAAAETAAAAFVKGALPLADNKYKVQIARTLIKRAILEG